MNVQAVGNTSSVSSQATSTPSTGGCETAGTIAAVFTSSSSSSSSSGWMA